MMPPFLAQSKHSLLTCRLHPWRPSGGWFHTGDQGFLDADGYVTLTGRIKELINRGGEKISPLEVRSHRPQVCLG
jgi:acyl-CoA synthetase (AMP-forming)/AMP-acid ligase II